MVEETYRRIFTVNPTCLFTSHLMIYEEHKLGIIMNGVTGQMGTNSI